MAQSYRFGAMELRPAERQLLVEGRAAHIGARAFDVLVALIDRRDRVVTKDELFDLAWPGLVVEENNLHVQISTLRKLLGAQVVSTIAGRGFRFMPEVEVVDAPSGGTTARHHNLPAQLNSFVGREEEIAQLKRMLEGSRLVTLVGSGGTGKTRLSLQAARGMLDRFPDGVWLVELAAVSDPERVPLAAAAALGAKEDAGTPLLETLARFMRDRRTLLVLDNCEHLIQASAELAKRLLQASDGLCILASSREALRITGESIFPMPVLAANDSARLFADRAAAVHPGFRPEGATGVAVAEICDRLDGIPLAIELAAARVNALPVEQIAARLSDSLDVLKGGDRTSLTRQQTLRASIDWSYDLLSIPERELLRRLSVFAGGWFAEAAQHVGAGGDVQGDEVLEILTRLVERSLVVRDADQGRYRLLDTVRQYARELLMASGEADGVRSRHLDCFVTLVDEMRPKLSGLDSSTWMVRFDLEMENILAAHSWCDHAPGGAQIGFRLTRGIKTFAINCGQLTVGHRVIAEALARPAASARDELRCRALFDVGQLTFFMGRYPEAQRHLEESLAIARELDHKLRIAAALQPLGMAYQGQGMTTQARATLEEALALARDAGSKRDVGAALNNLGSFQRIVGELEMAQRLYEEAMVILDSVGDHFSCALIVLNFAILSILREDRQRARTFLLEAIATAEKLGQQRLGLSTIEVCAGFAAACHEYERAARFYGVAEAQNSSSGLHRDPADEAFLAPLIAQARAELGPRYRALEDTGRLVAYKLAISEAKGWLGAS